MNRLEARVTALEKTVDQLESETEAVRALSGRLDGLEGFMQEARDKLSQLDEIRTLLEKLGNLIPVALGSTASFKSVRTRWNSASR